MSRLPPKPVFQPVVMRLREGLVGGRVERPPRPAAGRCLRMLRPRAMAPPWLQLRIRQPGQVRNTRGVKHEGPDWDYRLPGSFVEHVLVSD